MAPRKQLRCLWRSRLRRHRHLLEVSVWPQLHQGAGGAAVELEVAARPREHGRRSEPPRFRSQAAPLGLCRRQPELAGLFSARQLASPLRALRNLAAAPPSPGSCSTKLAVRLQAQDLALDPAATARGPEDRPVPRPSCKGAVGAVVTTGAGTAASGCRYLLPLVRQALGKGIARHFRWALLLRGISAPFSLAPRQRASRKLEPSVISPA